MVKTKMKNMHVPLVMTGYILFALLIIGTLISTTIPFGILLFDPRVLHINVAVTLLALTIGAILPVFLGYIIGDHSVKTKRRLDHHFAGMLFGLLSYWIMTSLAVSIIIPPEFLQDNPNVRLIIMSLFPGVCAAIIATILSIAHVRSRHAKQDILRYKPFIGMLIIVIIAQPLWSLIQDIIANNISVFSYLSLIIVIVSGSVSYATLRKTTLSRNDKLAWSMVSVSVFFIATYALQLFASSVSNYLLQIPTMEMMELISWVGIALAIIMWGIYWYKQLKVLRLTI